MTQPVSVLPPSNWTSFEWEDKKYLIYCMKLTLRWKHLIPSGEFIKVLAWVKIGSSQWSIARELFNKKLYCRKRIVVIRWKLWGQIINLHIHENNVYLFYFMFDGAFQKILIFFLLRIIDSVEKWMCVKCQWVIGSTSGSINHKIFLWEFQCLNIKFP